MAFWRSPARRPRCVASAHLSCPLALSQAAAARHCAQIYIGKFSFSPYMRSTINGTFHTDDGLYFDNHPHDLTLCMFSDDQWIKFRTALEKGSLCVERRQLATYSMKIVPQYIHVAGSAPKHDFRFGDHLKAPSAKAPPPRRSRSSSR